MTTYNDLKIAAIALFITSGLVLSLPQTASAQVYYQNSIPQNQQQLISYLYSLIAQLQSGSTPAGGFTGGQVLGANTFNSQFRVEVTTFEANNVSEDEAWVWGEIDLNGASFVTVWFEYGESRRLGRTSRSGRIDTFTDDTFRGELDDLDQDEKYFFRAVAQDPSGFRVYGSIKSFETFGRSNNRNNNNDDEPDVTTRSASDVRETSAELRGSVDMNDFNNGEVFFAYGEDEDDVEDVEDEDEIDDIDERGDDLQIQVVDRDLDGDDDFERRVSGLDRNTDHFFRICVQYDDEDNDETLECGQVREFETD